LYANGQLWYSLSYIAEEEPTILLKHFIPDKKVETIYNIDVQALYKSGIRGIITDLDNTLVGAKDPHATPELIEWLKEVKAMGFQVIVVSNNNHLRVETFAEPLSLPFIHRAKKPLNAAFKQALKRLKLEREAVVVIGDQMMTDVLGAKRMGLHSILVLPISIGDESFGTRINRRLERFFLKQIKKKGLMTWED
jgi:HAD superfamily phosphatase (TIGR01668 family)